MKTKRAKNADSKLSKRIDPLKGYSTVPKYVCQKGLATVAKAPV